MQELLPLAPVGRPEGVAPADGSLRPIVAAAFPDPAGHAAPWYDAGSDDTWVRVEHPDAVVPTQGWKLHVSATVDNAADVLGRVLPVLFDEPCSFKVAASLDRLDELNRGDGGPSQVGKFITVYPADDGHAVRLARALAEATAGLRGPRVPSDRALHPAGVVHYRYGAFAPRWMQTALGEVIDAIESPAGVLEPDRRTRWYQAPPWATDPFVAAGLVTRRPPVDLVVAGRYLTAAVLGSAHDVTVRLVLDLEGGERRVLKEARRDGDAGTGAWPGAQGRLRHEVAVLAELADDPRVPTVHDVFEEGDSLFVVMDHIPGLTLEQRVRTEAADGRFLALSQVASWASAVADVMAALHDKGMVYGDLKPPNVIVTPDGDVVLVDLESVSPVPPCFGSALLGTIGYASPQRAARQEPSVGDDVYSLGAVVLFMVTGAEPSQAPNRGRLLDRPVALLNPSVPQRLIDLVARCLDPDPRARPASMAEFSHSLAAALRSRERARPPDVGVDERLVGDLAARVCDEGIGDDSHLRRDIDGGMAGVVLALAQAAPEIDRPEVWGALTTRARWLASSPHVPGGPLPGLYVGEAGIGAALLRAGQASGDEALIEQAIGKGRLVAQFPHRSPDLFNGSAGRLRFHLMLWQATGDQEHLDAATAAGTHLVDTLERPEPDQAEWRIPAGYEEASGSCYLGYAHGNAGIADALLDLHESTGDARYLGAAAAGGRRLSALSVPVLGDRSGLDWPDAAGSRRGGAVWCHGAGGVARFLAHAVRLDLFPGVAGVCRGAARAAATAVRKGGAGQCHGLAGNADVLVDVYRATGEQGYLEEAMALARLMGSFLAEPDELLPMSRLWVRSTDLMNGWAGLLACALRLRAPDRIPHVLAVAEPSLCGAPSPRGDLTA